ncbi:MAG TPA: hypothetical protein VJN64_02385 [Terriglobales bacterium]|nr:hypothetical protein [Terriglobales bacterium]
MLEKYIVLFRVPSAEPLAAYFMDLSSLAGKTFTQFALNQGSDTATGAFAIIYEQMVLVSADGTVTYLPDIHVTDLKANYCSKRCSISGKASALIRSAT